MLNVYVFILQLTVVQDRPVKGGGIVASSQVDTRSSIESSENVAVSQETTPSKPPQTVFVQKVKRVKHRPNKVGHIGKPS